MSADELGPLRPVQPLRDAWPVAKNAAWVRLMMYPSSTPTDFAYAIILALHEKGLLAPQTAEAE